MKKFSSNIKTNAGRAYKNHSTPACSTESFMSNRNALFLLITTVLLTGCQPALLPPTEREVNDWIYTRMKTYYYWSESLPAKPSYDTDPETFFSSILNTFHPVNNPQGDRFSWIQKNAEELRAQLKGESRTTGMEYRIFTTDTTAFGVVVYTLPGSPAAARGIRRGDYFTRVNGLALTANNYRALLGGSETKEFTMAIREEGKLKELQGTKSLTPVVFQEDPVFFDTLYTIGEKKTGYLVYHQFISGPNGDATDQYDKKLEGIFENFKQRGISELIIDLRYNGGGQLTSAIQLSSLIAKGINDQTTFTIQEYNNYLTPILRKRYGDGYFIDRFKNKTQNVGNLLSRVFFLTSGNTASASELVINGLKPFMTVVLVGQTTVGKNVASTTIDDPKKRFKWGLQPIISKCFNSRGNSDYTAGFPPDVLRSEGSALYPYGDTRDPLLAGALNVISPAPAARISSQSDSAVEIYTSLTKKAGGNNVFLTFHDSL